jgi:hypothetical protein
LSQIFIMLGRTKMQIRTLKFCCTFPVEFKQIRSVQFYFRALLNYAGL